MCMRARHPSSSPGVTPGDVPGPVAARMTLVATAAQPWRQQGRRGGRGKLLAGVTTHTPGMQWGWPFRSVGAGARRINRTTYRKGLGPLCGLGCLLIQSPKAAGGEEGGWCWEQLLLPCSSCWEEGGGCGGEGRLGSSRGQLRASSSFQQGWCAAVVMVVVVVVVVPAASTKDAGEICLQQKYACRGGWWQRGSRYACKPGGCGGGGACWQYAFSVEWRQWAKPSWAGKVEAPEVVVGRNGGEGGDQTAAFMAAASPLPGGSTCEKNGPQPLTSGGPGRQCTAEQALRRLRAGKGGVCVRV
jgi:hypothetical protein